MPFEFYCHRITNYGSLCYFSSLYVCNVRLVPCVEELCDTSLDGKLLTFNIYTGLHRLYCLMATQFNNDIVLINGENTKKMVIIFEINFGSHSNGVKY
jgi:hypothetical protein